MTRVEVTLREKISKKTLDWKIQTESAMPHVRHLLCGWSGAGWENSGANWLDQIPRFSLDGENGERAETEPESIFLVRR